MRKIISCAALIVMAFSAIAEDQTAAFTRCAITKDDKSRLACFDKMRDDIARDYASQATKPPGYQAIELVDLKVDFKKLLGKKVAVQAAIQSMGEISFLKSDEMDMTPLMINTTKLPREDRKKLMSGCQMLMCRGTFYGSAQSAVMGNTIMLDRVDWR